MQARNPLQAQQIPPLGLARVNARVNARLSARASHTAQATNAAAAGRAFFQPAPLALAIALAVGGAGYWPQAVQAQTTSSIQIAAQPLGSALNELARQAGLQLTANPDLLADKNAPAVSGNLTAQQALNQLLTGSGLVGNVSGNAVVIRPAPPQVSSELNTLPEVVVTANAPGITEGTGSFTADSTSAATGLNLSLRETPQSVSVITRKQLDEQGLRSLGDVLAQTPGVYVEARGTPIGGSASIFSRGYLVTSFQVDGVTALSSGSSGSDNPLFYGGTAFDSAIYDSVTVVRGATGLLSGAGDPGGSVTVTRKRPTKDFQASVEGTVSRWNHRRVVADLAGPFNESRSLRGRLVTAYDEAESWVDGYQGEKSVIYGTLEADIARDTLLGISVEHGRAEVTGANGYGSNGYPVSYSDGTVADFSRHDSIAPDWAGKKSDITMLSAKLEHSFNDDWSGSIAYHQSKGTNRTRRAALSSTRMSATEPFGYVGQRYELEDDVKTLDAKLTGKFPLFGRDNDLIIGFNRSEAKETYPVNNTAGAGSTSAQLIDGSIQYSAQPAWDQMANNAYSGTREQYGAYLATRLRATDDLSIVGGARWSNWGIKQKRLPAHPSFNPANPITDDRNEKNIFIPYVGITYDFSEAMSAYASYTEIFNPNNYQDASEKYLDPETGKNYEIGLKGEWFGGRLNTSASIFETRKDNLAVVDLLASYALGRVVANAENETKSRGWELEISGEIAPNWHAQLGYTRVIIRDKNGDRLNTHIPVHQLKAFTSLTPSSIPGLTVGGGIGWQSEIYSSDFQSTALRDVYTQKAYATIDLMAGYQIDNNLSVRLHLSNLFNKGYRTAVGVHEYGPERSMSATLRYQF